LVSAVNTKPAKDETTAMALRFLAFQFWPRSPAAKRPSYRFRKGGKDAKDAAIMDGMDALRHGKIENIALITERKQTPEAR
jgi:hypothetical protein